MNAIVKALINAGIIDNVIDAEFRAPIAYRFEAEVVSAKKGKKVAVDTLADPITDAKFIPQIVRTAYYRLVGAILRNSGNDKPLFDESVESDVESCYKPEDGGNEKRISPEQDLAEATMAVAVIWRIAEHYARVEGNGWLRSINKLTVVRDANGNAQAVMTSDEIVRPFDEWLTTEIERNTTESQWGLSCQYARQLGHDAFPKIGLDDARKAFTAWLDEVPPMSDISRREKIVGAVADRKWNALIVAAVSGVKRDIEKASKDWIILMHSPRAAQTVPSYKMQPSYQLRSAEQTMAAHIELSLQLDLQETLARVEALKASNAARQLLLEQRMEKPVEEATESVLKANSGMGPKIPSYAHR